MAEQAIQFGLRTGNQSQLHDGANARQPAPHDADPQASARFEQAMAQAPAEATPAPEVPASPFALLGGAPAPAGAAAGEGPRQQALLGLLQNTVQRLLVNEDPQGRREVRLTLAEDLLPGVTAALYEDAGAWVADLHCSDAASYETLAQPASRMAGQLAQALASDAVWRVTLDEAAAGEPMTVEAFASYP